MFPPGEESPAKGVADTEGILNRRGIGWNKPMAFRIGIIHCKSFPIPLTKDDLRSKTGQILHQCLKIFRASIHDAAEAGFRAKTEIYPAQQRPDIIQMGRR